MAGQSCESVMQCLQARHTCLFHPIEKPQYAVTVDVLTHREITEATVARKKSPRPLFRKRKCEAVRNREKTPL